MKPEPPAPPEQQTLFPAKITVRTDVATRDAFKTACTKQHLDMQDALLRFMEATISSQRDHRVTHLDGSLCPLTEVVDGLARAAITHMQTYQAPHH